MGVWPGAGLSLGWLGIVGAVVLALRGMRRFAIAPGVSATIALLVAVAPLAAAMPLGTSVVRAGTDRTQPAFVSAEARAQPCVGTLQIVPQPDGGILATIVRGAGATLDDQSTLAGTDTTLGAKGEKLAVLAGNLASRSGLDASAGLAEFGIRFVLLRPPAVTPTGPGTVAPVTPKAQETISRTTTALDGNAALSPVGDTTFGRLWQHDLGADAGSGSAIPAHAGGVLGLAAAILAVVIFGGTVLLSIPTGAGREAVRQAQRDAIRAAGRANAKPKQKRKRPARPVAAGADAAETGPDGPARPDAAAGTDADIDAAAGADAGTDAGTDVGTDAGTDGGTDGGTGTGTGTDDDAGAGTDTDTDAGTDADTDTRVDGAAGATETGTARIPGEDHNAH